MSTKSKVKMRTGYNYDRDIVSVGTGLVIAEEENRTQQQFKDEADINVLVRRFRLTGELPQGVAVPTYGDFDAAGDYHAAMNVMRAADEAFMQMPADLRFRFGNDPNKFLEFVHDEKNRSEAERLGLVLPRPTSDSASGVSDAAPSPSAASGGGEGSAAPQGGAGAS